MSSVFTIKSLLTDKELYRLKILNFAINFDHKISIPLFDSLAEDVINGSHLLGLLSR